MGFGRVLATGGTLLSRSAGAARSDVGITVASAAIQEERALVLTGSTRIATATALAAAPARLLGLLLSRP